MSGGRRAKKKVPCEVYSRVVGYLRPVQNWNIGMRRQYAERKEYVLDAREENK